MRRTRDARKYTSAMPVHAEDLEYAQPGGVPLLARFYRPEEFQELHRIGMRMGFTHVQASPLTRSSYHAWEQARAATTTGTALSGAA